MHLEKPYLTTTRYRIKNKKSRSKKLQSAHEDHQSWLKRMGAGKVQLPVDAKGRRLGIYDIPDYSTSQRVTSDTVPGNGTARDTNTYTGNEILGITLNHKSNFEPIRKDNKQAAIDSARMRR
jgi:hypothetical protein